jgi:hypothetical protein
LKLKNAVVKKCKRTFLSDKEKEREKEKRDPSRAWRQLSTGYEYAQNEIIFSVLLILHI